MKYVIDEAALSERLNVKIEQPIRLFTLRSLGVDQEVFLRDLAPTFSMLALDEYDVRREQVEYLKKRFWHYRARLDDFFLDYYAGKSNLDTVFDLIETMLPAERYAFDRIGIGGRRKRSLAKFKLVWDEETHCWAAERLPAKEFVQRTPNGDVRACKRVFAEMSPIVTEHPEYQKLLQQVGFLVKDVRPEIGQLVVDAHQVCNYADVWTDADNSPEGIHQDGADYIVSALVVERAGIIGAESVVYGPDKRTEYLRHTLMPGEGLFQIDSGSPLWHYLTKIREDPSVPPPYGSRSTFGFDIYIK